MRESDTQLVLDRVYCKKSYKTHLLDCPLTNRKFPEAERGGTIHHSQNHEHSSVGPDTIPNTTTSLIRQGRLGLLLGGVITSTLAISVTVTGFDTNFKFVAGDGDG